MTDAFFAGNYQTQRVNQDITTALDNLEHDEKKDALPLNPRQKSNPFRKQMMDEEDNSGGYKLDDLLNGYVIDEDALSAIDECLIHISLEWDLSEILNKDLTDCERLISRKCNDAHSTIISSIIEQPNVLYDTLIRLARKMKAISLVINNQKMIYVPHSIEELIDIGSHVHGLNTIVSVRRNKRTGHAEVGAPVSPSLSPRSPSSEDEPVPFSYAPKEDMFGSNIKQDLESMIFANRQIYKESSICKRREKQYANSKGKFKKEKSQKTTISLSKNASSTKEFNETQKQMSQLTELELTHKLSNETTPIVLDKGVTSLVAPVLNSGAKKKAHPNDIKCEGCGNHIDFGSDYDHIIIYNVPIKGKELFYFHDSFCVTLRRLKESVRRYVLDQALPEARRAETTVGYVRNLLTNFNTLITTGGVVPRPNPLISSQNKAFDKSEQLKMMQFVRGSAHKLILRQQALEGREAKNFEDEYSWKFGEIPQSIQYTDMVVYGPCLAKYVIQQLLSKQLESLWLTLAFVVSGMSATTSLQIVEEHRTDLSKVKEMDYLDVMLTSMIEAADYTIAMALYLSAYMMANAERDLSRSEDFEKIAEKYIRIASHCVGNVESDHLLSLLLETPTDIGNLSVFEIAIKYGIDDFMDDSRIQMLMAHMWSEFDFLDPAKNYRTTNIELFDVLGFLTKQPARFYYCPVGRYWTESVMYMVYICVVSTVLYEANYTMSSDLSYAEWCMWVFNIGFVAGEITQMAFDGLSYLTDTGNYFDVIIMVNWAVLALMRFGCKTVFSGSQQCHASTANDTISDGQSRNKKAVVIYMAVFCLQICILWSRVCLIFATSRAVGPFISMVPGMVRDILKWTFVLSIFYIGYTFGAHFIIAGDISEDCASDGTLENFSIVSEYNFILLMGQSEWSILEANDCMDKGRSLLLKLYMFGFSILGTVLLLNLLIAMMASTYEQIREGTAKQVNFARAEQVFSLSHTNAIIPPPLNVVVFAFSIVWFVMEFLVWLLSCGHYILNIEKLVPVSIDYDIDKASNKNARDTDITQLKCCKMFQKYKKHSGLQRTHSETARYCQFCRCYMRVNGNISHYFKLFVNYRLDEADVKFMKSLMQNAGICPQCYRPYRIYEVTETGMKTNRLFRWQVVLELLSFYVFMSVIYLPLIILIALPALFNALFSFMDDIKSHTKMLNTNRQIIKDDKYVQLLEQIIEKEGTTDNEVLSTQVTQLNRKLIQVKVNQQSTANTLAEQSISLEDLIRIVNGMVPYIKQIDTKIDKSRATAQELHSLQLTAFESGMEKQSEKLEQSKDVLDAHTDYNRAHEQQLKEQLLEARRHAEEMDMFKQQLSELKELRAKDEQLKLESEQRQNELEQRHATEIESFNKELKQQRMMREMEMTKQEKMSKKQAEQLRVAHEEQISTLQKDIQRQQFLRTIEEQKIRDETEKRELMQQKQAQDMAIIQSQMQQLRVMKEAEDKKRDIEVKMREKREQKRRNIEQEILRIKHSKQRNKKRDSFALQQSARLESLQTQLIALRNEQMSEERSDKQQREVKELKDIQHKSKVRELKEQMSRMIREQKQTQSVTLEMRMKEETQNMKHKIQMEKLQHSMSKLQNTILTSESVFTSAELANICNLDMKEAETLMAVYDTNGDGVLDRDEFTELKNAILNYQKQFQNKDVNYDGFIAQRKELKQSEKAKLDKLAHLRKELLSLTQTKLARKCREAHLSSNGTKADLVKRLMEHHKLEKN